MSDFLYPLDTTGTALSNRVRGEMQTLSPPTQSNNFHFILPKAGPYYRDSMVITHVSTGRTLIRGIDWEPGHYFHSASFETESVRGGIYQSILFLDRTLSGQVRLTEYFVLGGEWSLAENKILEVLSNRLTDPRSVTYEQVSGKPDMFPPIGHMHPANDLVGMREQVEATLQISQAIREQTNKLPGKLQLLLENYYTRSQVDQLIVDLASNLLEGVAGPELERMLQDVMNNLIGDYYNKGQVDQMIAGLNSAILERYTKVEVDNLLANKVTDTQLASAISNFATYDDVTQAISSIQAGALTRSDLNAAVKALENVDTAQQSEIDSLRLIVNNFSGNFDDFVKLEDLLDIVPKQTYDYKIFEPATISVVKDTSLFRYIESVVASKVIVDGAIKSAEIVIPGGGEISIVPKSPSGGIPERVEIKAALVEYDATDEWDSLGYVTKEAMWTDIKNKLKGFVIRASSNYVTDALEITYSIKNVYDTSIEAIINSGSKSDIGPLGVTTSDDLLVSFIYLDKGVAKITNYSNANCYKFDEVKEVKLNNAASLLTTPVKIDFSHDLGPDHISVVTGVRVLDQNGNSVISCDYVHEHIARVSNIVTVYKPSIDLSPYGASSNLTIEVSVITKTTR